MNTNNSEKYIYRKPEGMWDKVFSDHAFTPILDRAEGIYLYDTHGKRSFCTHAAKLAQDSTIQ